LFLLFINDLPQALQEATVVLFADDTNILLTNNKLISLNEKIQKVRKQLDKWFHENHLIINTNKNKVLFFQGRSNSISRPTVCLSNKEITYASNVNFLGIHTADNLSWAIHTQHLSPKLNKALYLIKFLRDSVSLPILRNVYLTKFESILKYGIIFWEGRLKDTETVFKVQKKKKMSKSN
jgi:hypothetical protein